MSRPWRDPNTGIWYLRRRVPKDLRVIVGKDVHKASLGTKDVAEAKRRHAVASAELDARWSNLRLGPKSLTEREAHELVRHVQDDWLAFFRDNPSNQFSWHCELYSTLWTASPLPETEGHPGDPGLLPITNIFYQSMKRACFVKADEVLARRGIIADEWGRFTMAKAVGAAYQRASEKLAKQAEGHFDSDEEVSPASTFVSSATAVTTSNIGVSKASANGARSKAVLLSKILEDWWRESEAAGRKLSTYESYRNTVSNLVRFLGHEDASLITPLDIVAFKDHRLKTPSRSTGEIPSVRTVKNSDLSGLKTLFGWAVINHRISSNPASGLTIKLVKAPRLRSKGFTDAEAHAILSASYRYRAKKGERPGTAAAKRWVPWICAFTGARVGEIAQMRRQDVRREGDQWIIRITPEAGTQKTNDSWWVPLHPQLIEIGFPSFFDSSAEGPLFLTFSKGEEVRGPWRTVKNRLSEFAREVVSDRNVAPNHGWRHRFKTIGIEAGIDSRILDAIQGQAPRTVAESYGEVTTKTMTVAINKLPSFLIEQTEGIPVADPRQQASHLVL